MEEVASTSLYFTSRNTHLDTPTVLPLSQIIFGSSYMIYQKNKNFFLGLVLMCLQVFAMLESFPV